MGVLSGAVSSIKTFLNASAVSANNIANINTPGFKSKRVDIANNAHGGGAYISDISSDTSNGPFMATIRPMDIALQGEGYLGFKDKTGDTVYSRDGRLYVDVNRNIVSKQGYKLDPPVNIPSESGDVSIAKDGSIYATVGNDVKKVGQIKVAKFSNPAGLKDIGGNMLAKTLNSGEGVITNPGISGSAELVSGAIEGSNVNYAQEAVNAIITKAAIKVNVQAIKAQDEMLGDIIDILS